MDDVFELNYVWMGEFLENRNLANCSGWDAYNYRVPGDVSELNTDWKGENRAVAYPHLLVRDECA